MSRPSHLLHGACSCGRNRYSIAFPESPAPTSASVLFDSSSASRLAHASPITARLLVPLPWYASATYAYYPDETHSSIRRVYHSSSSSVAPPGSDGSSKDQSPTPAQQRHFCGYCGTHFSSWEEKHHHEQASENPSGESSGAHELDEGYISVAVETLLDDAVDRLMEIGLWPSTQPDSESDEDRGTHTTRANAQQLQARQRERPRGAPWFEEAVEDGELGRMRRQRGGQSRAGETVEWEIFELENGELVEERPVGLGLTGGKRKLRDVDDEAGSLNVDMR